MSRADYFAYGFTLLAPSVAFFAGSPPIAFGLAFIGVAIIVRGHLKRDEEEPLRKSLFTSFSEVPKVAEIPRPADPLLSLLQERQMLEAELQPILEVEEFPIKIVPAIKLGKDESDYRREKIQRLKRDIEVISRQLERLGKAGEISSSIPRAADWQALAARFERLDQDVRADWSRDANGIETWRICGGQAYKVCESLCKLAGAMLLRSAQVSAQLDETLRSEEEDVARWLYFLKKAKGLSDYQYGFEQIAENEQKPFYFGSIHGLASLSCRICIECSAKEI